jgi:hypothetical protein
MLEARDRFARWGLSIPPRDKAHHALRHRLLVPKDSDLNTVSRDLETLARLRNQADYDNAAPGDFASDTRTAEAIQKATDAIAILDAVAADTPRRAAVIAAIRAVFP